MYMFDLAGRCCAWALSRQSAEPGAEHATLPLIAIAFHTDVAGRVSCPEQADNVFLSTVSTTTNIYTSVLQVV